MKTIISIIFLFTLSIGCNDTSIDTYNKTNQTDLLASEIPDTVIGRITNLEIVDNRVSFDIETKLVSSTPFKMGSSTFTIAITDNALSNPVLTNINPKYTVGNGTGYYNMMVNQFDNQISLQILYLYEPSSYLSNEYERIATIKMIMNDDVFFLTWNREMSFMINPQYGKAHFILNGLFNGIKK